MGVFKREEVAAIDGQKNLQGIPKFGVFMSIKTDNGKPEDSRYLRPIVRNAKAKMIEGSFKNLEEIMRGRLRLPGHVKGLK